MDLFEYQLPFRLFDDLPPYELYDGQKERHIRVSLREKSVNLNDVNSRGRDKIIERLKREITRQKKKYN